MVFFAFHQYLATNFHLMNFFAGNYISVLFAAWNDVSIYPVSNILQVILVFIFCGCLCYARKKPQYFKFMLKLVKFKYGKLNFRPSFREEKFNNVLYLWKSEVTTIKKGKIFNISLNIAHFSIIFFLQSLVSTCVIHCVNLMVFLYHALNLETYIENCDILENFILSFCFEEDLLYTYP